MPDRSFKTDLSRPSSPPAEIISNGTPSPFEDESGLLQLLLLNSQEYFLLIDTGLRIRVVNEATRRQIHQLLGAEVNAGTSVLSLAPPERHPALKELYADVLSGNLRESCSIFQTTAGEKLYLQNRFAPARDGAGHIVGVLVTSKNITEKRARERELLEKEERWRFALEGSNLGLWDWNLQTGEMYFSASYKKLYGFEEDELENKKEEWTSRIHPDDLHRVTQAVDSHTASGNPYYETTYRLQDKRGRYRWVISKGMLFSWDSEGRPLRMIGTHTDITEQKAAEEALRQSNERFGLAAKATSEALWEWDRENDKVYYSPVYKDLFGFDVDPDNNHDEWHDLIHPADREETIKSYYDAVSDPATDRWEKEYRYSKSDGSYVFVSDHCLILRNEAGVAVKVVGAIQDISNRKKAEAEALLNSERYKYATKATSDALYDRDLLKGGLDWGDGLLKLFGHQPREVTAAQWESLVHPDDRERVLSLLQTTLSNFKKRRWIGEYRFQKADGTYSFVLERGFIIRDKDGAAIRMLGAVQDITGQKLKEQQLLDSNERFRLASQATSDIIWDWDILSDSILWAENYQLVFGWTLPADKKLSFTLSSSRFHPEDHTRISASLQAAIENPDRQNWQEEFRFEKADGDYAHVSNRAYIIRNAAGGAIRMIGAMQDISSQKEKERQLKLNNERFLLVTKATSDAIWDWDLKTDALEWGEGLTKLFGYAPGEVAINEWEALVHEADRKSVIQSIGHAIGHEKKKHWKSEYRFRHKDGSYRFVYDRGFIVRDESGIAIRMIGAMQDNTDRKEKERQLLESNERFDIVMKATNDLIWDWNLETGAFYRDKEGIRKVYGVDDEATIDNIGAWLQRVHPEDHNRLQETINEILHAKDQNAFEAEYRFRKDNGDYTFIHDRGRLIRNAEGKPVRLIGAAQNITERKLLEQQLLSKELNKQKLISQSTIETQERERGEIGKELHDNVNQILTTTKLYLDLSMTNPELKDELIVKCSKNVINVINEIRQLSRSLMNPSLGDLGLADAISDLIENINLTKRLKVSFTATEKVDHLLSDAQRLMIFRIIQEALNNAVRHAQASAAVVTLGKKGADVQLQVTDNGVGFDPATVKKGAGLKNIQNRVYLANGTLAVQSVPGKGCTLSIIFPINPLEV